MKKYEDGLKDALNEIEILYVEKSPIDDMNEDIQEFVDELYVRINKLADLEIE